ncbi:uncharacterized protein HMPREF1541_04066 [Cyphellophora europaea CBS 101466]|uniref:Uncharacterized protein n=1 Tax=Cyphellophora europaea (strain CBS 101466) TaxID=1220924 RepID=W2S0K5_CYPE1|nr:uncharacterized protein HMPREF1541_04066 [Cyphellophora europaea CBS 101466]ETN42125.1 hypothetical protein HMPREF1541_04066 [Cyphellophora europaea CBS 101466]
MNLVSSDWKYHIELIQDLTREHRPTPTNLIVCISREDFLHHLALQVQHHSADATSSQAEPHPGAGKGLPESQPHAHHFLTPTLRLFAASKHVKLIYCPTILVLRGYLSSYNADSVPQSVPASRLIIVDLLALHHGTSEFTLQGLSRSLATAVSAAHAAGQELLLTECRDIRDQSHPDRGSRLWDRQVPLLSGSVKIGLEGSRWAGRSMTIKAIASRWFTFAGVRAQVRTQQDEDEMLI